MTRRYGEFCLSNPERAGEGDLGAVVKTYVPFGVVMSGRRARLIKLAIARNDLLAQATLVAGEPYRPEPDYLIFTKKLRAAA